MSNAVPFYGREEENYGRGEGGRGRGGEGERREENRGERKKKSVLVRVQWECRIATRKSRSVSRRNEARSGKWVE